MNSNSARAGAGRRTSYVLQAALGSHAACTLQCRCGGTGLNQDGHENNRSCMLHGDTAIQSLPQRTRTLSFPQLQAGSRARAVQYALSLSPPCGASASAPHGRARQSLFCDRGTCPPLPSPIPASTGLHAAFASGVHCSAVVDVPGRRPAFRARLGLGAAAAGHVSPTKRPSGCSKLHNAPVLWQSHSGRSGAITCQGLRGLSKRLGTLHRAARAAGDAITGRGGKSLMEEMRATVLMDQERPQRHREAALAPRRASPITAHPARAFSRGA
ncbi:hypothetical protein BC628DRAFT_902877 [Trametes gibbosa]|nr:hypothetical protein BC628DRAFT_902877 [Trametes gibbosa]